MVHRQCTGCQPDGPRRGIESHVSLLSLSTANLFLYKYSPGSTFIQLHPPQFPSCALNAKPTFTPLSLSHKGITNPPCPKLRVSDSGPRSHATQTRGPLPLWFGLPEPVLQSQVILSVRDYLLSRIHRYRRLTIVASTLHKKTRYPQTYPIYQHEVREQRRIYWRHTDHLHRHRSPLSTTLSPPHSLTSLPPPTTQIPDFIQ